jgi:pimeloyl-ACP methyl ester carboxylesterase
VAVLYLHGFGSRQSGTKAEFFRRRFLDRGLAFCSFDFQGHGDSGGSMLDLTLSRNLSDVGRVHALLGERGYAAVVLMGSSMGGGSALWYAARRPEGVAAAIHVAPSVALGEGLLEWVGPENARRWEREGKLLLEGEVASCEVGWGLIADLADYRVERLRSIYRTPTLIFQGKNDASVPWRKVLDFVVGCRYEEIDLHLMAGADHRMIDRLDYLWRLADAFLATRGLVR